MPVVKDPTFTGVRIPYSDLTGTLDPHKVYETRAKQLATMSKNGLERFAYLVFGPSLIGSLAFALNPYSNYEFPTMHITPANRVRKIPSIGPAVGRSSQTNTLQEICANSPDGDPNFPIGHRGPITCTHNNSYGLVNQGTKQPNYTGFVADTTVRTRPINSKGGEFELFHPTIEIGGRNTFHTLDQRIVVSPNYPDPAYIQWWEQHTRYNSNLYGSWAWIPASSIEALRTNEVSLRTSTISKHGYSLLADSLPTSRVYTLTRNLAELKDLPMLYRNTVLLYKADPSILTSKGLGNQYLNMKFGWEPLVKDILDLLAIPETITKEVNRLIDRNGMPSVFRAKRKGRDALVPTPSWTSETLQNETFVSAGTTAVRNWELRSALTYTLKFPNVDVPILRDDLTTHKFGLNPNPSDVYELVPWSWLADWFSGLGDYVDLMNELAKDQSLFNYGYLTYVSEGKVTGQCVWSRNNTRTVQTIDPASNSSSPSTTKFNNSFNLRYKYQKRSDVSTLSGAKVLSRPTTLAGGQLAILGALLAKFAHS